VKKYKSKYIKLSTLIIGSMTLILSMFLVACGNLPTGTGSIPPAPGGNGTPSTSASATTTTTSQSGSSTTTNEPLIAIRMIDDQQGWALSKTHILKTADGGQHWTNVTPPSFSAGGLAVGQFKNALYAWVVVTNQQTGIVTVLRTTDAGQNWGSATINDAVIAAEGTDQPHFLTNTEGWLEVIGSPGAGQQPADIFHSTDGGQSWQKIASTTNPASGLSNSGFKSGISFEDTLHARLATSSITGNPTDPGLYLTSDGGHTWTKDSIGAMPETGVTQIGTEPPVFFGTTGILPVKYSVSGQQKLLLYTNNGNGWTKTQQSVAADIDNVYVVSTQSTWATDTQGKFYNTSDGGQTWQHTAGDYGKINALSFVSANDGWAVTDTSLLHRNPATGVWETINYVIQ
jgi:photosystem II stability/assembly factor-like uncharacterized protein